MFGSLFYIDTITLAIQNNNFLSVEKLNTLSAGDGLYPYSYAFVEYVVSEYGYNGLLELYRKPDISIVFNISNDEFQENWMNFLIYTYSIELSE